MKTKELISRWKVPLKKTALILGGVLCLVAIGGFFVAPPLVKSYLLRKAGTELHRQVHIKSVQVNPFTLSVTVNGLQIEERGGGPFVGFDSLHVRLGAFASIFSGKLVVASMDLERPKVRVVRNEDGSYNFSDLLREDSSRPPSTKRAHYSFNNIRITGGTVDFDDRPMHATHQVTDIQIGIPFLSNLPSKVEINTEPVFSAKVDGQPVEVHGQARPFSDLPEMVMEVRAQGLDLPKYLAYIPADLGVGIPAGTLDANGSLSFKESKDGTHALVLSGDFVANGLDLEERRGGTLARLPRAQAQVISADLLNGRFTLSRLAFDAPEVNLSRKPNGRLNIEALLPANSASSKQDAQPAAQFSVGEISVTGGTLHWNDEGVRPAVRMDLKSLDARITSFNSAMTAPMGVAVSFTTDKGATVKNEGTITPSPLAAQGSLEAAGLPLALLEPYFRSFIPVTVEGGTLLVSSHYDLQQDKAGLSGTLAGLSGNLSAFTARLPGGKAPFLKVASATLKDGAVDLGHMTAQLGGLSAEGARLSMTRAADGNVDLVAALFPAPSGPAADASPSWQVGITKLAILKSTVEMEDLTPSRPAQITLALKSLEAQGLSTQPGVIGRISLRASLNGAGNLNADGPTALAPLSLDWRIGAKGLPVMPFEPYFSDLLEIQLTGGSASAKGRVTLKVPETGAVQASFTGDMDVNDLATVDKAQMQDFLKWKSLHLGGVNAKSSPPGASIKEVALNDFYSRLIVSPEGKLNLSQIVSANEKTPEETAPAQPWDQPGPDEEPAPPPEPAPAPPPTAGAATPPPAQPFALYVENVTLAGGNINYSDHYIKPNYNANMTDVAGRISGLSSDPATRADMEIRAKLDHQAPIEINGTLNPLAKPIFLDIKGKATDVELSPMSPYSGRFAGYIIEKGKLNVDVSYHVENGKLNATNHIFLDQFTLGDKVESKEATKLPIKLAIALLKDRQGRIDLTLPVSGSLNDPRFKLGRVILRIFVNLIAKAVTSPFALLGHLFGGGGQSLSFIEFSPGVATLDAAARDKAATIEKALQDRPGLRLDVTGRSDPATDREGLKKVRVERLVKAEKMKELVKRGTAPPSLDDVTIDPKEYTALLFKAYKHMKFPKPRTLLGTAKELPAAEMEQVMLANTAVTDDDLRKLAQERAQAVKDAICKPGGVEATRVFLSADTKPSAEAAKAKPSRVDLSLK